MKEEKRLMLSELCSAGRWTEFLNSLPLNRADVYEFKTVGQIMTLRVIAAQQSNKPGSKRRYSVKSVNYDSLTAIIEANSRDAND